VTLCVWTFRALSGRLKCTVRRHKFNKDSSHVDRAGAVPPPPALRHSVGAKLRLLHYCAGKAASVTRRCGWTGLVPYLTHPITHTHTQTLSLTHKHTHTHTHTFSLTHTLSHTHRAGAVPPPPALRRVPPARQLGPIRTHTHTHTHTNSLSLSRTHTHTLGWCRTHSHTHTHTQTLSLSHTHTLRAGAVHTHTLSHTHTQGWCRTSTSRWLPPPPRAAAGCRRGAPTHVYRARLGTAAHFCEVVVLKSALCVWTGLVPYLHLPVAGAPPPRGSWGQIAHSHTHTLNTHTLSLTHSGLVPYTLTHSHTLTHTHTHTLRAGAVHTHTHTHSHTLTHTHTGLVPYLHLPLSGASPPRGSWGQVDSPRGVSSCLLLSSLELRDTHSL